MVTGRIPGPLLASNTSRPGQFGPVVRSAVVMSIEDSGQPPGGTLRVRVERASDGACSSTWRVWGSRNHNDVYVGARTIVNTMKASLHESGQWQHSFISDEKAAPWRGDQGRHMDRWSAPDPVAPGLYRAYGIIVPDCDLAPRPDGTTESGSVVVLPSPGPGRAVEIVVALFEQGSTTSLVFDECIVAGGIKLPNGGGVGVIGRTFVWDESVIADARQAVMSAAAQHRDRIEAAGSPRLGLFGFMEDGTRVVYDLAVPTAGGSV